MPPTPQPGVPYLEVALRPDELVAAWRADARTLLLPAREPLRLQQRVAVRITVAGLGVGATITGRVASTSRHGSDLRFELAPDDGRVRAVERLRAVARGDASADYPKRAPRLLAAVPAVVQAPAGPTFMTTFSVSERGCGLAWSGPAPVPDVGARVDVRLGAGSRSATLRGAVCWTARSGRSATVGVFFLDGARHHWARIFSELRASGAPPA